MVSIKSSTNNFYITDYDLLETIGDGTFAKVKVGRNKKDGKLYAIKIMKKQQIIKLKQVDHIHNEISILSKISFPFVTKMLGFNQDSKYIYLGLEFVSGGEFFAYLRRRGNLILSESMYIFI